MFSRRNSISVVFLSLFAVAPATFAADFTWVPKGATGTHTIVGQEIILTGAGQEVTFDLEMSGWDPNLDNIPLLGSFQAAVDSSGYNNGIGAVLNPLGWPATPELGAFQILKRCTVNFMPDPNGASCVLPSDCPGEVCIDNFGFVFQGLDPLPAVSTASLNYEFAATAQTGGRADNGASWYGATLVIEVPLGASGTYTIGFRSNPAVTFMRDVTAVPIAPIILNAAQITVRCAVNADCDDGSVCTDDSCMAGGTCQNLKNYNDALFCCNPLDGTLTLLDDGNPCSATTCDVQTGQLITTCLAAGVTCGGLVTDPCDAQNTCDGACNCVNRSAPAGTACGSNTNNACTAPDTCDGAGTCDPNHAPAGTACGNPANTACTNPDLCSGNGGCRPNNAPNGTACDDGAFCSTGERCVVGNCTGGTATCADDGIACTDDSCDEVNDVCVNAPNNQLCDNALFCDGAEICDPLLGCVLQAGSVPDCNDLVGCTDDSCDEVNDVCVNVPNSLLCDNAQFCDGVEICDPLLDCVLQAGSVPDCNDLVGCTTDSCDEVNDVCVNIPDNAACDNGQFCDGAETCDSLNDCQPGVAPNCDDGVACTVDSCDEVNDVCTHAPDNLLCDNGLFCDGVEVCDPQLGCVVLAGTVPDCNDNVGCTDDSCNEGTDSCDNIANNANCDNGLFCDGVEICDSQLDCVVLAGTVPNCIDLIGCTDDSCNEATDSCDSVANNANCDNGLFCDGAETCDPVLDCQAGTAPNCNDNVGCTDDSCNEGTDSCDNIANNASCDNGLFCDGAETCDPALDCQPGTPPNCNDNVGCTDDSCNEGTDSCDNVADNTSCNNGLFCDGVEICDPQLDCVVQAGTVPDCNDNVGCTDDACDELNRVCTNVANDGNCNNGQFCDGVEICDALLDCVVLAGTVPDCADTVGCTDDSCDEVNDVCVNNPNDAACDNGQFCDGVEICDAQLDCVVQAGTVPDCDDLIGCTDDSCDEVNDVCVNSPNDGLCPDDALFCNGSEFCDAALGCDHTGSPCGGPCDEDNDVCLCDAPVVVAAGSRYFAVSLQPPDAGPQAIVVRGMCAGGVARYVGAPLPFFNEGIIGDGPASQVGLLVEDPADGVFMTPAEWGAPVYVTGLKLAPGSTYEIWADCGSPGNPAFSEVTTAVTFRFGDVDGNSVRNIDDVFSIILGFQGNFLLTPAVTRSKTDIAGCEPNLLPNINDALWSILGFQGKKFVDVECLNECPPCHPADCDDGDDCTADSCVIETGECLNESICP